MKPTASGRLARSIFASALVIGAVASAAGEDSVCLKLRSQSVVRGDVVTVGDVVEFGAGSDELAEQIAGQPVVSGPAQVPAEVSREQLLKRLEQLGVNPACVLLDGALRCQVTRHASATGAADSQPPLVISPRTTEANGPRTLALVLRAHADSELHELGGTAEISFERGGQEFLQLTTPPWDFHVSSRDREKLGLREFQVLIRRDGQVQRKVSVMAQVRLVRPVVVAQRPLNPGNFVRSDDVALETRVFEQPPGPAPSRVEEVVGQQVKRFVAQHETVAADAIKAVDLVVRARPVTVTGSTTGVQVRLTGVALDSGGYGDTVRVRLGDTRHGRKMLHGVVTGLGVVRLAEGSPL